MFLRYALLSLVFVLPLKAEENASDAASSTALQVQRSTVQISDALAIKSVAADQAALKKAATINVKGISGELKDWSVTDLDGKDVKAILSPRLAGNRLQIDPTVMSQFVLKPSKIETHVVDKVRVMELPGGIVTSTKSNPNGQSGTLDWLRLTFLASPLPAIWDPLSNLYSTQVTFGLKESAQQTVSQELAKPITVLVSFDGLVGDTPPAVKIGGSGLENEQSFTLKFRPTTEHPRLRVRSSISDVDLELKAVSRLSLQSLQSEILGLGLDEAVFNVQEILPHGEDVQHAVSKPISISVEGRAKVDPEQPTFEAGSSLAQFKIRSSGLGNLEVKASFGGSVSTASVQQRFPTSPIIAVLLGGALGGYGRRFMKGADRSRASRWIVEGLVVGLIAFVAGVLGVGYLNLPAAIVATEAGAFLTGAITGFVGVAVLDKLTGSLKSQ